MMTLEIKKANRKAYDKVYSQRPETKEKVKVYNARYERIPANKKRRKELFMAKRKYVWSILGTVCQKCGYNKTIAALHFHHLDSSDKTNHKDTLGIWLSSKSLEFVLDKIKTIPHAVLCANCHAEVHDCEK